MKKASKKSWFDFSVLLSKINQWNWIAIRTGAVRFLLVAGSLSFLGMLVFALFPMLSGYYVDGVVEFGGEAQADEDNVTINYLFTAPESSENVSSSFATAERIVWDIYAPKSFSYQMGNFCFDRIEETLLAEPQSSASSRSSFGGGSSFWDSPYEAGGFMKDECINKENVSGQRINYGYQTREITLFGNSNFYFPYDHLEYDTVFRVLGSDTSDKESVKSIALVPKVVGAIRAPNWDVAVSAIETYEGDHPGARITIEYRRPLLYRLLAPILLVLMLGVIFALPFIQETSTFLETLIGIIFGLWGLHEVLIPADVTWPTIIDPLILSLYALLGFFTLLRVVIIPTWKRVGK